MFHLIAELQEDRATPGRILGYDENGGNCFSAPCLGRADNQRAAQASNARRIAIRPDGDTPTGVYKPARLVRFEREHRRMGIGWLPLDGLFGQCCRALEMGRTGLGIHAGRGNTRLVPTYGCIRLLDKDFLELMERAGDQLIRTVIVEKPA